MGSTRQLNTQQFIDKAKLAHGDRYLYDKVVYKKSILPVIVICKVHGEYTILPCNHISRKHPSGCPKCVGKHKTTETFIEELKKIHKDKLYVYDKTKYVDVYTNVIVTCATHGDFEMSAPHLLKGSGCPKCVGKNKSVEELIALVKTRLKYPDNIDFGLITKTKQKDRVKLKCLVEGHGEFTRTVEGLLQGRGCPICGRIDRLNSTRITKDDFVTRSTIIHNGKYNYCEVIFGDCSTISDKVKIICPVHGLFKQRVSHHMRGHGCPKCVYSKGNMKIYNYLISIGTPFKAEYKFKDCKFLRLLSFDFAIFSDESFRSIKAIIEYDGEQHFRPCSMFGGEKTFIKQQIKDAIKNQYCEDHGIPILRIPYTQFNDLESIVLGFLLNNTGGRDE
jgi:very-short-patch-repair endonuclease